MLAGGFALFGALEMGGCRLARCLACGASFGAGRVGGHRRDVHISATYKARHRRNGDSRPPHLVPSSASNTSSRSSFGPEGGHARCRRPEDADRSRAAAGIRSFSALIICVTLATFLALWFLLATTRIGREMRRRSLQPGLGGSAGDRHLAGFQRLCGCNCRRALPPLRPRSCCSARGSCHRKRCLSCLSRRYSRSLGNGK